MSVIAGRACISLSVKLMSDAHLSNGLWHAGLPLGAAGLNGDLLQISDMLLTSFTAQTENQILALVQAALHKPSVHRASKQHARPSELRQSIDVQISSKQKHKHKHKHRPSADAGSGTCAPDAWLAQSAQAGAYAAAQPDLGSMTHALPDEGMQRWTLSAAHCSDEVRCMTLFLS